MVRTASLTTLAILIVWSGLTGCSKPAVREKPLPDPLLTSKKPIEGKPHVTESGPTSNEELPPPPPIPEEVARGTVRPQVPVVHLLGPRSKP